MGAGNSFNLSEYRATKRCQECSHIGAFATDEGFLCADCAADLEALTAKQSVDLDPEAELDFEK